MSRPDSTHTFMADLQHDAEHAVSKGQILKAKKLCAIILNLQDALCDAYGSESGDVCRGLTPQNSQPQSDEPLVTTG